VNTVVAATVRVTVALCAATEAANRKTAVESMAEGMIKVPGILTKRVDGCIVVRVAIAQQS
jgi:hypothetical protein